MERCELKDVAFARRRNLDEALDEFCVHWRPPGLEPRPIDAATTAQRVWAAHRQNQAQAIRLPTNFGAVLPQVLPFLTALPVSPNREPLSAAELVAWGVRDHQLLGRADLGDRPALPAPNRPRRGFRGRLGAGRRSVRHPFAPTFHLRRRELVAEHLLVAGWELRHDERGAACTMMYPELEDCVCAS